MPSFHRAVIAALILGALPGFAQTQSEQIRTLVKDAVQSRVDAELARTLAPGTPRTLYAGQYNQQVHLYALLLLGDSLGARALADATEARTDTQPGSQAGSGGSTSLVTKGLAPKVLSLAVERGALDRSVDGSVVTFRTNPAGLLRALSQTSVVDVMLPEHTWWNGLSAAVSFDTNRGSDPGTLLANRQQITSWSVRSQVINHRDPTASAYRAEWGQLGAAVFRPLTDVNQALGNAIADDPALLGIINGLQAALAGVDNDLLTATTAAQRSTFEAQAAAIAEPFLMQVQSYNVAPGSPLALALEQYRAAWEPALAARSELQDFIAKGALFTVDWTVSRDPMLPDLHTTTFVLELSPDQKRRHDLTLNGSISFYGSDPGAHVDSFRDSKVTAQYDVPIQTASKLGTFVLGLAGRWEYIPNMTPVTTATMSALMPVGAAADMMGSAAAAPAVPPGHVGVFQLKLSIPVKGSGMQIPLALTASNRKDQIQEKWNVGANFGLTFNFDSFLTALRAR